MAGFSTWICSFLLCGALHGQVLQIRGRVLDPARAPIGGAKITALHDGRSAVTVSDRAGEFSLALDSGAYTLTVSASGFRDASKTIDPTSGAGGPLEFVLQIATYRESVTVTEQAGYEVTSISSST